MKHLYNNHIVLMLLNAVVFVGGYFFLRLAYHMSDNMPFAQEIILIVLGTIATILITAMLLNKQTSVELEKEQSIKFIDLKTKTYQALIDTIEAIVIEEKPSESQLNRLKFHTHRLAIFSSPEVLHEYRYFLDIFYATVLRDQEVSREDAEAISQALARLTVYIRADLIGELDSQSTQTKAEIRQQILENSK